MKKLLVLAVMVVAGSAQAKLPTSGAYVAKQVLAEKASVEKKIAKTIATEIKVDRLSGFKVYWNTLSCLAVQPSGFEPKAVGVCTVTAGANSVGSQIAIVKGQNVTNVSIIYADVE